ncbi:phosphoenolpyruvate mutase [Helicobacter fennelliae]
MNKSTSTQTNPIIYVAMAADLLHAGHINILKFARELADSNNGKVVVGLLTDSAIAQADEAPFLDYEQRKIVLENLTLIDSIIPQESFSYKDNLAKIKPQFIVHGDDWQSGYLSKYRKEVLDFLHAHYPQDLEDKSTHPALVEIPYSSQINALGIKKAMNSLGISTAMRQARLKKLLTLKKPLRILESHSALSALIAQNVYVLKNGVRVEFDGFWSSSLTDSTLRGKPDIEALDLTNRLQSINEIFEVTTKSLIYDADTGGRVEHFIFSVKTLERLGVSAVIIEDKTGLKKNSLLGNEVAQSQESIEEFCAKITAGKRAQVTSDFMIIARIESLILDKGQDDALKRAFAYIEAGADGIMIHSRQKSPSEILSFLRAFRAKDSTTPIVLVPTSFNAITATELADAGANIIIYANHALRASFIAMQEVAQGILEHDRSLEIESKCMSVKEILSLIPGTI